MEKLTKTRFTNLEKTIYPELGLKKRDIVEYYIRVATKILRFLEQRALVRTRYPNGIYGEYFYEKDIPKGTPKWIEYFAKYSYSSDREVRYVVCNNLDTLLWLANLAAIELHIPLSRIPKTNNPDLVLFDIDPEPPAGLTEAVQVAFLLKKELDNRGIRSYVKSSGLKGLHIVIPIKPICTFEDTRAFVRNISNLLSKESELIVSERSYTNVPGTVLIDYPQNSERSTVVAPYSLRPTREATVSTPLDWNELIGLQPYDWNIFNVPNRKNEPWADFYTKPVKLDI